jgi:thioesterase domain-containing protein
VDGDAAKFVGETAINRSLTNARIVQLKSGRRGQCFFIVPGLGGRVEGFVSLAAQLPTPITVFAVEARGIDGSTPPDTQVEEMARHYLTQVRAVQATGPYFLAGHSFGGLVAFEMARRLIEAEERVGCLILLDTGISKRYWPRSYSLKNLRTSLLGHATKLLIIPFRDKPKYLFDNFRKVLSRFYDPYGLNGRPIDAMVGGRIAGDRYLPEFYSGKLIFFRASVADVPADPEILWRNRVQELEVHSAAGGHNSMLDPPNVSLLAVDISACLMKASAVTAHIPAINLGLGTRK